MDYTTWFEYILQLLLDYSYSLLNGLLFFTFKQNLDYLKTTLIQNLTKKDTYDWYKNFLRYGFNVNANNVGHNYCD